ncbi:MAG: biotin/lipoyl-binding protein [Ruminococcaceae bacterium]|nr:biotin/lipoyl-binding protein [Oscillospiraceae bacterium]
MKKFNVTVNGNRYEVEVEEIGGSVASVAPAAPVAPVAAPAPAPVAAPKATGTAGSVKVEAPMPGTVLKVNVKVGDSVNQGDTVLMLEAMKMENEIAAPADGVVASINVSQGATVETGDVLVTLN